MPSLPSRPWFPLSGTTRNLSKSYVRGRTLRKFSRKSDLPQSGKYFHSPPRIGKTTRSTPRLAVHSSAPLFPVRLGRARIPILLMTVFAGVVDLFAAGQHFRGVFRVYGIERQRRGVMQTMR